ncbi:MAG: hypothetical protein QOK25_2488 [Thermoleophilaceae bacterium]|jgi:hypothetical protein|nr:hypothetical protein [Thermoleophilaceae bacterium]
MYPEWVWTIPTGPGPPCRGSYHGCQVSSSLRACALLGILFLAGCNGTSHGPAARPSGTLYLAGVRPGSLAVVHVAQGRVERRQVHELKAGDPQFMIAATGGRLAVYGHDRTYALDAGAHEPGKSLGESWYFVPSATPGRVWLAVLDPRRPGTTVIGSVREVTVDGRVTVSHSARPPKWPISGAVDRGLLIQADALQVWDPATGRVVRRLPGVFPVASRGSLVASCADRCPTLHLTDTRTGSHAAIRPKGFRFSESYDGGFSRDGGLLALPARTTSGSPRVAVVDVATHAARLVPGPALAADYPLMTWSSSGWLFFNAGGGRLAAYRPGAARARLLPMRVRPFIDMAAG